MYTWYTRILIYLGQGLGNSRVAIGTLLSRVALQQNVRIKSRELWEGYTDPRDDFCGQLEDFRSG